MVTAARGARPLGAAPPSESVLDWKETRSDTIEDE